MSSARRKELGNVLQDLMKKALDSFIQFDTITYKKISDTEGGVDFLIKENNLTRIALECKNWGNKPVQDAWIKDEIIPRFKGLGSNIVKYVIGHLELTEEQTDLYFRKNGILYYDLSRQIKPEDSENLKNSFIPYLVEELSHIILLHTGKFREDHVSEKTVIMMENQIKVDNKTLNLKSKEHTKKQSYIWYSDWIEIGDKPLDRIMWILNEKTNSCALWLPSKYNAKSEGNVAMTFNNSFDALSLFKEHLQVMLDFDNQARMKPILIEALKLKPRKTINYHTIKSSENKNKTKAKRYGLDKRFPGMSFWQCYLWYRTKGNDHAGK